MNIALVGLKGLNSLLGEVGGRGRGVVEGASKVRKGGVMTAVHRAQQMFLLTLGHAADGTAPAVAQH